MSGLSKTCLGFSLPRCKAENCLTEHHSKVSILTMLHTFQVGQNGGANVLDIDTVKSQIIAAATINFERFWRLFLLSKLKQVSKGAATN